MELRERRMRIVSDRPLNLHVVEAGAADAPLLVFLHGFPDHWRCWDAQLGAFASDFLAVAPDQRGYNLSDRPRGTAAYKIDLLARDIEALIRAYGRESARIVGHDWGAAVAWHLAITRPALVERLAVLNVPHPQVFHRHLRQDAEQRRRSRYMFWFQAPGVAEWMLSRNDYAALERAVQDGSVSDPGSLAYVTHAKAAWREPGALTAMLGWYRAAFRYRPKLPPKARVKAPTRIIWGDGDRYLRYEMAEESVGYCDHGEAVVLKGARHWVQKDRPEEVNRLLREHLQ